MGETFHIEPLGNSDQIGFEALYGLYEESIPASERKSAEELRGMLGRSDYRFLIARDVAGLVQGFAILFVDEEFVLLEYLAVSAAKRSMGLGSLLFRHCTELYGRWMVVEVESAGLGEEDRIRRVEFYRQHGCRKMDGLSYQLPLGLNPPRMDLYLWTPEPVGSIAVERVERILGTLYQRVYGQDGDDRRIAEMLLGVRDPILLV